MWCNRSYQLTWFNAQFDGQLSIISRHTWASAEHRHNSTFLFLFVIAQASPMTIVIHIWNNGTCQLLNSWILRLDVIRILGQLGWQIVREHTKWRKKKWHFCLERKNNVRRTRVRSCCCDFKRAHSSDRRRHHFSENHFDQNGNKRKENKEKKKWFCQSIYSSRSRWPIHVVDCFFSFTWQNRFILLLVAVPFWFLCVSICTDINILCHLCVSWT